ncbi:MAG: antibiotic biosynthesis monooxygenase [Alphaproteobacteria bacterium]|nr:antibiotic biosynthesis monooxygenase [Alphaproteobacteria bacterium]
MIIVSGQIHIVAGGRPKFLKESLKAVSLARKAPGCIDFVVAADPLDEDRVNVFEQWGSDADLENFRGGGLGSDLRSLIVRASVQRHRISSSGSA